MPNRNRNRSSEKNTDKENRTGKNPMQDANYQKLPDDLSNQPSESVSTRDNTANPKYSHTRVRDDEKDIPSERV